MQSSNSTLERSLQERENRNCEKERTETARIITESNTKVIKEAVDRSKENIDCDSVEREKRRCNVLIRGITEPESKTISEKIKEDKHKSLELLNVKSDDIISVRRVGRIKTDGSFRPLVITLTTPELANNLHNYGRGQRCKNSSGIYWINADLIPADRLANYKARQLLKQKKNQQILRNQEISTPNKTDSNIVFSRPTTVRRGLPAIPTQTEASPFITELLKKR